MATPDSTTPVKTTYTTEEARARYNASLREGAALKQGEFFWRDHKEWLETKGYRLRPRYQPGWEPDIPMSQLIPSFNQDFFPMRAAIVDATRVKDGKRVLLKRISKSDYPHEIEITRTFSTEPLANDPRNHCIHLEDVLESPESPDVAIAVFPFLQQLVALKFDTVGEVIDFIRQVFMGLQFMHQNYVAHRDIDANNIMMDGDDLFPEGWNHRYPELTPDGETRARTFTRTEKPPKYHFIDLGLSRQYDPSETNPLEPPIFGGDKTVPEFQTNQELFNPFHTDIYYIGNMIREYIIEGHAGIDFLKPLINDMVQDDPTKRPTMDEVVTRFEEVCKMQSYWKLRSRPAPRREHLLRAIPDQLGHWKRRIGYIVRRVDPIPSHQLSQ
ncbi:hypothetical protein BDN72DRAFT_760068 [Pluteus cervinus]|uniref:Uncharacterized protein n=1 Tax=Pluteus cervinus TaxID=181527 RepID=A0ACD3B9K2_9AGAR|nr:hypothetical protein BDN72DRAFT_760068 [Pluteus cervinus]